MKVKPILFEIKNSSSRIVQDDHSKLLHYLDPDEASCGHRHIYLIDSEAEIKEGDWYIKWVGGKYQLFQANKLVVKLSKELWNAVECLKIIASTNSSLKMENPVEKKSAGGDNWYISLPQLSEQSIKILIDYYNKNKKMPENVELNFSRGFLHCKYCGAPYPYEAVYCNDCGTKFSATTFDIVEEKTTREQAMERWNNLTLEEQFYKVIPWLTSKNMGASERHPNSLTGREIEEIFKEEIQQEVERGITITNTKEPHQLH